MHSILYWKSYVNLFLFYEFQMVIIIIQYERLQTPA